MWTARLFSLNAITRKAAKRAETQNYKASPEVKDRKLVKHNTGNSQRKNCQTTYIEQDHMAGGKGDTTFIDEAAFAKKTQVEHIRAGKCNHTGGKLDGKTKIRPDFKIKQDVRRTKMNPCTELKLY